MFYARISKCLTLLLVAVCLVILNTFILNAQLRPLTRNDSATIADNKGWYFPANYQFQVHYPRLSYVPPITSDMPLEIMMSYIVLDSIMRNWNTDAKNISIRWNEEKIKNDTIIAMVKYLYKIKDYDPVRFNLYKFATYFSYIPYKMNLLSIDGLINGLFEKVQKLFNPSYTALSDLLESDYILRVHVNSVDTLPWINHPNEFAYGVNATVLDTLKGKVFQNSCSQYLIKKNTKDKFQSVSPCINFCYFTGPYSNYTSSRRIDPSLLGTSGNLTLQPGQDVIVTLSHGSHKYDFNYDYFSLSVITVIPVINGQVIDRSKIWSDTPVLNYPDWKIAFNQRVNMLLNGGY